MLTGGFFQQYILVIPIITWLVSQGIKVLVYARYRSLTGFREIFKSGGMPSAHTSFMLSLAMAVGLKEGFFSTIFSVTLALAGIVVYDAMHVRMEAGKHAEILNEMYKERETNSSSLGQYFPLETSIGHTFYEVLGGGALGIYMGIMLYFL